MTVAMVRRQFTVAEYHEMAAAGILSEDDRVELLHGEIVQMSPIGKRHAASVDKLTRTLVRDLGDAAIVRVQSSILLGDLSEPQPDLAVLRWRDDFYANALPGPDDILLLVEVADTTLESDRRVKLPLYARAGVPEAWLVDLIGDAVEVHRDPGPDGYRRVERLRGTERLTPAALRSVDVAVTDVLA